MICQEGLIKEIKNGKLSVELSITSACATCHAKNFCISTDTRQRTVEASPLGREEFSVGEKVRISMRESLGKKAVLLAYVLPCIVLLSSLIILSQFIDNEIIVIFSTIGFVGLYYLVLWIFSKRISKEFIFYAEKY